MASKWQRRVLKGGAAFADSTFPFILRLVDGETIDGLVEFASAYPLLTTVYTRREWRDISSTLARVARKDELSHVVLQGLPTQGRRSAQCVIRRFEALSAWRESLFEHMTPDEVEVVVQRQVAYGKSREKLRKPRKTPLPKRPAPIAPIKNKDDVTLYQIADMTSVIYIGSLRTIRVFDSAGKEAWLLPRKTLAALPLFSFDDALQLPVPEPVADSSMPEEGPEADPAKELELADALTEYL